MHSPPEDINALYPRFLYCNSSYVSAKAEIGNTTLTIETSKIINEMFIIEIWDTKN